LTVVTACEIVGLQVKLQISDAGGANARMAALLTGTNNQKFRPGKPDEVYLKYINPLTTKRNIWVSLCSVHSLKNHKNLLVGRKSLHNHGKHITWKVVQSLYHKLNDDVYSSRNVHSLRKLRRSVAYPDKFTQQNVNDAKVVFEEETIAYLLQFVADQLDEEYYFDDIMKEYERKDGHSGEILDKKLMKMKEKVHLLPDHDTNKVKLETELAFVEVSIVIHKIFIERFLNGNARLVLGDDGATKDRLNRKSIFHVNIDCEIERMAKNIKYLDDWISWSASQRGNLQNYNVKKWPQLCISSIH